MGRDYLEYGERTYGERFAQTDEATGYSPDMLTSLAWVPRRIPPGRPRAALSWSHHGEVAALEPVQQVSCATL